VYGERGAKLYGIQSVAAAIENMLLMAHALELGTCWIGAFAEMTVARLMECPEYVRPCAIISVGYPDERPNVPVKQGMHEFVHIGKFGDTLHTRKVEREKRPTYMKFQ
jgi:nitroreductase